MKLTRSSSITLLVFRPPLGQAWQNISHYPFGLFMTEQWPGPSQLLVVRGDLVLRIGLLEYLVYGPSALVALATPTAQQSLLQPHPLQKRQQYPPYCTNHCPSMIPRYQVWSFFMSNCGLPRVFMPVGSSKTAQNSVGCPCAFPSTLQTIQLLTPSLRTVASMTPSEALVIKGAPLSAYGPRISSEMAAPIASLPDLSLAVKQTMNFLLMICSSGAQLSQQVVQEAAEGSTHPT